MVSAFAAASSRQSAATADRPYAILECLENIVFLPIGFCVSLARGKDQSIPKSGLCLFQLAAEPYGADTKCEPGRVVGFHRDRAQCRRPHGGLEFSLRNFAQKPAERLVLVHADH